MQISTIRLDGDTQSRVNLNQELIAEYAEAMKEGANFPPVTVFYDGADNWLSDGFHRLYAARNAGLDEIAADVKQGTLRDAKLFSMSANAVHGLRRTNADKRRAVMMALGDEEWRELPNTKIAEMCEVTEVTVRRARLEVEKANSTLSNSVKLLTPLADKHDTSAIVRELKAQLAGLNERLNTQSTDADTSIAVQQAIRQERERAELAMYEYKKKVRDLELLLQDAQTTTQAESSFEVRLLKEQVEELNGKLKEAQNAPTPQTVVEVREVVPDDVKERLEELEDIARQKEDELSKHQTELKKLQETLEAHRKAGKDLAGIREKIDKKQRVYNELTTCIWIS